MKATPSSLLLLPTLSLLGACGGSIDGIWMLYVPASSPMDAECETSISHNFSEGYVADEDDEEEGPWIEDEDGSESDGVSFVQIVQSSRTEALLIAGNAVYPGTKDSGVWTFSWDGTEEDASSMSHEMGYAYTLSTEAESAYTLSLTLKGGEASGSISSTSSTTASYTESDRWGEQTSPTVGESGQLPSYLYLVYDGLDIGGGKGGADLPFEGRPLANDRETYECSSDPCELVVTGTCSDSNDVSGVQTGYADQDAYDWVSSVNQQPGA